MTNTNTDSLHAWVMDQEQQSGPFEPRALLERVKDAFEEGYETAKQEGLTRTPDELRKLVDHYATTPGDPWDLGAHLGNLELLAMVDVAQART